MTLKAFEMYLPPQMARKVAHNHQLLSLGGELVQATAMFTDIAGFTSISEQMEAKAVSEMLNSYFSEVMDEVFLQEGTLLKFIGDAIFALWGAPLPIKDHAEKAVIAGLAINEGVKRFNSTNRFPPLPTRIGIHTGPMVVGNLGSNQRRDYTALGDSVNLASRLEGLNKYFGSTILISADTHSQLTHSYGFIFLGRVAAVGKSKYVELYGYYDPPLTEATKVELAELVQAFIGGDLVKAEQQLKQLGQTQALKPLCTLYQKQLTSGELSGGVISFSVK
jgi:adenylate cyclase